MLISLEEGLNILNTRVIKSIRVSSSGINMSGNHDIVLRVDGNVLKVKMANKYKNTSVIDKENFGIDLNFINEIEYDENYLGEPTLTLSTRRPHIRYHSNWQKINGYYADFYIFTLEK